MNTLKFNLNPNEKMFFFHWFYCDFCFLCFLDTFKKLREQIDFFKQTENILTLFSVKSQKKN